MRIEHLLTRVKTPDYNCFDLLREAWLLVVGEDLIDFMPQQAGAIGTRTAPPTARVRKFKRLVKPESPCIVFMHRPKAEPHVGMFYQQRILHLSESGTHHCEPFIATLGFPRVSYYK